jgi:signal transduction histidine kinase/DNA-binding LacI/PurR family transcriptional regulator
MTNRKPTFGFLAVGVDEPYQITIREGILQGIHQTGGRLISLPGIPAFSEESGNPRNPFTMEIVSPGVFDGLIVLSSTFSGYLTQEELLRFCHGFSPIPLISLGIKLPGFPSLRIDNREGMKELMEHLFFHHGYKKPVFIGGPTDHPEAMERESVFREVLKARGITPDERLINHSSFFAGSGEMAMKDILSRGLSFDCVVCANDSMAIEVEAVLDEAYLTVPVRCALTGFDNIATGARKPFSLTTVHQPLREMGYLAATMINDLKEGKKIEDTVLRSSLVLRESCGCTGNGREEITVQSEYPETVRQQKEAKRARLLRMIGVRLLGAPDSNEIQSILSSGLWDLEAGNVMIALIPQEFRGKPGKQAVPFYFYNPVGYDPDLPNESYPMNRLFPPGYPDRGLESCLVCPLNFGEENLGYMIFEEKPGILEIYYILSLQLSNSIKVWELELKRKNYTQDLEREIGERTAELREEVERRWQAEQEARAALSDRIRLEQEILAIADREQHRIGQDLHDDICQRLAGVSILAGALERQTTGAPAGETAKKISGQLRDVIQRTKSLSRGLFPVILEQQGLPGALEELAGILDGQPGPACRFEYIRHGEAPPCPGETRLHLYRIAQEASHNAFRHSGGSLVTITLKEEPERQILSVADNGRGFKADPESGGLGQSTMRYRAGMIRARLELKSTEAGTEVTCILNTKEP